MLTTIRKHLTAPLRHGHMMRPHRHGKTSTRDVFHSACTTAPRICYYEGQLSHWTDACQFVWQKLYLPELGYAERKCLGNNKLLLWPNALLCNVTNPNSYVVDVSSNSVEEVISMTDADTWVEYVASKWGAHVDPKVNTTSTLHQQLYRSHSLSSYDHLINDNDHNLFISVHRFERPCGTISELKVQHHPNMGLLAMDDTLALLPSHDSFQDACNISLHLYNYHTQKLLRTIPLDPSVSPADRTPVSSTSAHLDQLAASLAAPVSGEGPPYIQADWARGLVLGDRQAFYVHETSGLGDRPGSVLYTCVPVDYE
jgi:hypothetical protein